MAITSGPAGSGPARPGQIGGRGAQPRHPGGEAVPEQRRVEQGDHIPQRVMARDAVRERLQAAQEGEVLPAPDLGLDEIIRPGQRRTQQQKQDFRQRIQNLGRLARVPQRRKPLDQ
jgi:hypothetical protein